MSGEGEKIENDDYDDCINNLGEGIYDRSTFETLDERITNEEIYTNYQFL
jgi:hypothetical protein